MTGLLTCSYGGGVQSTAIVVLAATGQLPIRTFLFANTGDDSEDPATLHYVRTVAAPYAHHHDIALHELHRTRRDGSIETLYGRLTRPESRSLPIPVRMSNGAPGTRSCTADFKIVCIGRWLKAHGANADNPATVAVGISLDEFHRANNRRVEPYERVIYPLLDLGLRRTDRVGIIRRAGLPVPPKSSCWFCPLHRVSTWADMRRDRPHLFVRACELEELLYARRAQPGRDPVWLTRFNRPWPTRSRKPSHYSPTSTTRATTDATTAPASPDIDPPWTALGAMPEPEGAMSTMTVAIVAQAVIARALLRHRVWAQGA